MFLRTAIRNNILADASFMQNHSGDIEYRDEDASVNLNPISGSLPVLPADRTDLLEKIVIYKALQREIKFAILCEGKKFEDHPLVRTLRKLERVISRPDLSEYFCGRKEDPKFSTFPAQIEKAIERVAKETIGQCKQAKSVEELSQFIKRMCGPSRTGLLAEMAKISYAKF